MVVKTEKTAMPKSKKNAMNDSGDEMTYRKLMKMMTVMTNVDDEGKWKWPSVNMSLLINNVSS